MSKKLKSDQYNAYLETIYDTLLMTKLYLSYLKQLFENKNRIEIITNSTPEFFNYCKSSFEVSIIIGISKVTDPSSSGTESNLTIRTLFEHFVCEVKPEYLQIKEQIDTLESRIKIIRKKRNKQIAHLDLKSFQSNFDISYKDLTDATQMLEEIFNCIIKHLPEGLEKFPPNSHYSTQPVHHFESDARGALIMIEKGRRFDELINSLSEDCLRHLIPNEFLSWKEKYFEQDVIQFVDQPDES